MLFLEYPPCCTCKKARTWLEEHQIAFTARHIKENNPTYEELKLWYSRSGLPLKRFFNTSGLVYQSLGLKDRLAAMSEEEQLRLLASDGMLVKRPLVVTDQIVLVGFRLKEWEDALLYSQTVLLHGFSFFVRFIGLFLRYDVYKSIINNGGKNYGL